MPKKQYNLENIRALLTEGFTAEELRRLCYDEADFKPVYDQLAQNTGKAAIIDLLLEHAHQKLKTEALLTWAKAHNPAMYAEHQPYEAAFAVEPPRPAFGRRASRLGVMVGAVGIILLALALSLYYLIPGAANHQPPPEREAASSIQPTSTPPPPPTLTPVPTPTLSPLPDGFNIGVAEFTRLDETVSEEASQQVSQWLYETVERSLEKDFDSYIALHIRGPADMGPVKGNDKVSRAEHAAILAQRHNLTILIYGVMGHGQGGLYFEPNFFVPYDQKDFDYVRELGGSTRFGAPIYLGQPSSESPLSSLDFETKGFVNRALLNRAQALSDVLLGLSDFFGKRFVEAIKDFERALVASDKDGQEVIDMLLGTAYLRTTDASLPGTAEWQAGILNAQQAFSQALTINSDYARAHLGMGTAWLNRAKSFTDTGQITSVDADLLQKAVDEYDKALKATDRPPLAHVPEKAHYQLGQTYQLGYEKKLDSEKWSPEEAQKYYLEVITASNEPDFPRELNWFVGNAYASSCLLDTLVAFRSGQPPSPWPEIEAKCQKGLEILEPIIEDSTMPAPLTEYRAILAYIIAQQPGREADSCRVYDQVITEAAGQPNLSPDWVESIKDLRRQLHCE